MGAQKRVEAAKAAKRAAATAYLPSLDISAAYSYNQHNVALLSEDAKLPTMTLNPSTGKYDYNLTLDPSTGKPVPSEVAVIPKSAMTYNLHNVVVGALTLTQPIYMGGAIGAANEIADYGSRLALSQKECEQQNLLYEVDAAYWQVVALDSKTSLARSYVALMDTLLADVEAMRDEGVATNSDCLTVDVKCHEARLSLTEAEDGLVLARMALCRLCGLPLESELELSSGPTGGEDACSEPEAEAADMPQVLARRPDLASLRNGVGVLEATERLVKSDMLPKVSLLGVYRVTNPNTISGFENRFGGGFSVGVALTMPLWNWGRNSHKLQAARCSTIAARFSLEDAQEGVALQVRQAEFRCREAVARLRLTEAGLRSADANLLNSRFGFREGVTTITDLIMAHTAWLQAHSENLDAQINLALSRAYRSKVLGNL